MSNIIGGSFNDGVVQLWDTLPKDVDNDWLIESNLDLNDNSLDPSFYKFKITYPLKFNLISDFKIGSNSFFLSKSVIASLSLFSSSISSAVHKYSIKLS